MTSFPWKDQWPEIRDLRVHRAFQRVDRGAFVPDDLHQWAQQDAPLPIGCGQTISQPFVVALMTQALDLHPGDRVLEIGTGSGFQTAILCELAAREGEPLGSTIYSVERFPKLASRAATVLNEQGYFPHLRLGDGATGWPEEGPYDAIILSAAPPCLPRPLWAQLAEDGRLTAPIGRQATEQVLWLLGKREGRMRVVSMGGVRFVPLVSPLFDEPGNCVPIEEMRGD